MAIAALVLWVLTVAAGMTVLIAGNTARRAAMAAAAPPAGPAPLPAAAAASAPGPARFPAAAPAPASAGPGPGSAAARSEPPPIPRVTVHAAPGDHPLLEFSHPALGVLGLGCWFIYVGTRHAPLAWVSFGIAVVTIALGLVWLVRGTRARRRRAAGPAAPSRRPPRLVLLHGATAAGTLVLAVLTALSATH